MMTEDKLQFHNILTQTIEAGWLNEKQVQLDVLRLDKLHDVVSGNKWFKLKYYLQDAVEKGYKEIATFGGAYSNHIVATAYMAREQSLKSIGIIRGERPLRISHTLQQAESYGMQLQFISRNDYQNKNDLKKTIDNVYWTEEGGYGDLGARGAAEILSFTAHPEQYTHIFCATGTGTMLAGISKRILPHQQLTGISVLKNNFSIEEEITALTGNKKFTILHDFHFGGYAKHPAALLDFISEIWNEHGLPTDIVYTSKTLYAIKHQVLNNLLEKGSKILMIHSGGLQGNLSLRPGVLPFL